MTARILTWSLHCFQRSTATKQTTLQELQLLEKQIEDQQDAAEQHQAVYDYLTMTGDVDLTEPNQQHQLQQLAELITTLQKDTAEKVWTS